MKRDMELVRKMLFWCEALNEPGEEPLDYQQFFAGYPDEKLAEHRYLLFHAGLARGFDCSCDGITDALLDGLTWAGHDFLETARNDTMWNKAKETASKIGIGITVEGMKKILSALTSQAIEAATKAMTGG